MRTPLEVQRNWDTNVDTSGLDLLGGAGGVIVAWVR